MGQALAPRVIRGGDYVPTVPRSGGEGDNAIWRKRNLITRGQNGHFFEEAIGSPLNLNQSSLLAALTGTLTLTINSATITGTGTAFLTECHLGQRIIVIDSVLGLSVLLVPKRIISNTSMVVWKAPYVSMTAQTGYRMSRLFAVNDQKGTLLWGNVIELDKGTLLSVGNGEFLLDGVALQGASLTATRAPQISILDPATGNYSHHTLGMNTPTGITAAAVAGGVKGMRAGNYSLVFTPNRKQTDGYNNPSLRVDVLLADNDKVRVTFPAMHTARGQNAWGVWVTPYSASLGADLRYLEGPWFFLQQIDDVQVSSAGGTFDFEWYDAEITGQELVSFNNDSPTDAEFVELLNYNPVWLSCQGPGNAASTTTAPGPFIVPSKPTNIEAAPLDLAFSSSPPETILGVVAGPGRLYLLTTNHLQIAQATPSEAVPILIRPYWKDGFACPEQVVFHNGTLYGYTVGGPSKSVSDGDEQEAEKGWAGKVWEITKNWNPGQVLVAYDPFYDTITFFHIADRLNSSGFWTTRYLMWGVPQQRWVGDGEFSQTDRDSIVSGVATVGEQLNITMGGRGPAQTPIFAFGLGSAEVNWWIVPQLTDSGIELRNKCVKPFRVTGKITNPKFQVYGFGSTDEINVSDIENGINSRTGLITMAASASGAQSKRYPVNVPNCMLHTVRLQGTSPGTGEKDRVEEIAYEVAQQGVRN